MKRSESKWIIVGVVASLTVGALLGPANIVHSGYGGGGTTGGGTTSGGGGAGGSGGGAGASGAGGTYAGGVQGNGNGADREQIHADARACDPMGDIWIRTTQDGGFSYGGLEYHLPTFSQCMKEKGYPMSTAARDELTNFGTRR